MKHYRRGSGLAKVIFLLMLIAALSVGGVIWLDFLGILDAKQQLAPVTSLLGFQPQTPVAAPLSASLLDDDRIAKERQAVELERSTLNNRAQELSLREAQVSQKENEILERERSLDERQKSLTEAVSQYDNKVANLEQTALYMAGMPPEDAVAIMNEYEVLDLVDLLRTSERLSREAGENSLIAYWLSLMPDRERAADIQRLMVEKPGPGA